ncbi:hypothetical protein AcV5_006377 [Taiwanofungus camphoratus]|nr:hypothetical protein AcV5_006377 [Antrodia cinnamomea]
MSEIASVTKTLPEHWRYIAEGGATIVFSYAGPPDARFDHTVLRLRKVTGHDLFPRSEKSVDAEIIFQRAVIQRLLPVRYLPRLESTSIDKEWLVKLASLCEEWRPVERRNKDQIDVDRKKAVLATNLVGGNGWTVEIKPKWGFLPRPAYLSLSSRSIKTRTCRFCMHAHLKVTKGEDVAVGYCPLDLFSGVESRVRRALRALWDAWIGSSGSINNMRVFVKGRAINPMSDLSSLRLLARHPVPSSFDALLPAPTDSNADLCEQFTSALLPLLLQTPVLRMLSTLQRTLDPLDIEGLADLWARAHTHSLSTVSSELGIGAMEPTSEEWSNMVDTYLDRLKVNSSETKPNTHELRYYCLAYLLSATFKDCSIMLKVPSYSEQCGEADGRLGEVNGSITVVDLDVKSISRLRKWMELDKEIVTSYTGVEPRWCIDQLAAMEVES